MTKKVQILYSAGLKYPRTVLETTLNFLLVVLSLRINFNIYIQLRLKYGEMGILEGKF